MRSSFTLLLYATLALVAFPSQSLANDNELLLSRDATLTLAPGDYRIDEKYKVAWPKANSKVEYLNTFVLSAGDQVEILNSNCTETGKKFNVASDITVHKVKYKTGKQTLCGYISESSANPAPIRSRRTRCPRASARVH